MASDIYFSIRVVRGGRLRTLTERDIADAIRARKHNPAVGLQQLRLVIEQTLRHMDAPKALPSPETPKGVA